MLQNLGMMLWIMVAHVFFALVHILFYKLKKACSCMKKLEDKIGNYLYWNGLIRLSMEVYFDVTLLAVLNVYVMDWDDTKFKAI